MKHLPQTDLSFQVFIGVKVSEVEVALSTPRPASKSVNAGEPECVRANI
jgi:hypothetical protein